jgi:hypothetical protein
MAVALTQDALNRFTGSDESFRHNLMRKISYSQGVQYLAEVGNAYWLVDKVATLQLEPKIRRAEFQVWKLKVDGSTAMLSVEDGNDAVIYSENITFTDFPLDHVTLWFANNMIYLPSEH